MNTRIGVQTSRDPSRDTRAVLAPPQPAVVKHISEKHGLVGERATLFESRFDPRAGQAQLSTTGPLGIFAMKAQVDIPLAEDGLKTVRVERLVELPLEALVGRSVRITEAPVHALATDAPLSHVLMVWDGVVVREDDGIRLTLDRHESKGLPPRLDSESTYVEVALRPFPGQRLIDDRDPGGRVVYKVAGHGRTSDGAHVVLVQRSNGANMSELRALTPELAQRFRAVEEGVPERIAVRGKGGLVTLG